MHPPRRHDRELERLAALRRLGVLDTEREERFDRIARLAAMVLDVPVAFVSFVDDDRQWFKAAVGSDLTETPRSVSFCGHAIVDGRAVLEVPDALADERFHDNPAVTDDGIRFYAGQVVRDASGLPLGTLCVVDHRPRRLTSHQRAALADLGAMVEAELERQVRDDLLFSLRDSEGTLGSILQNLAEGLLLHDASGILVEWNGAAARLLGIDPEGIPRWTLVGATGSPLRASERPWREAHETADPVLGAVIGVRRPDGDAAWLRVNSRPIVGPAGEALVLSIVVDETDRVALEAALRSSELTARASLDALEQGVLLLAPSGEVLRSNPAAEEVLGWSSAELSAAWQAGRWFPGDANGQPLDRRDLPFLRALRGERVRSEIVTWVRPDGEEVRLRLTCTPDADGRSSVLVTFTDVTTEQRMIDDLARFALLFEHANDLITVIDEDGHVSYSSPSYGRILGYPKGWRHPDGVWGMVHLDDLQDAWDALADLVAGRRGTEPFVARVRSYSGAWRHLEFVGVDLLHEPSVRGVVLTARDTTEREVLAAELAHLASHDPLSGLFNRSVLEPELTRALARADRLDAQVALCFIDLDRFKAVNDRCGHAVGDEVIVEVARRLESAVRAGDLVMRIGGDEFVVVLEPVASAGGAHAVADRLHRELTDDPIERGGVVVGASMGVAIAGRGESPASLLQRADHALYVAKRRRDSSIEWAVHLRDPELDGVDLASLERSGNR